jgi:vacuolar-type H+-ATPase subunit I/STV1
MKFHSDYYDYGFSRNEIEKFLLGYEINLVKDTSVTTLSRPKTPVWAEELKAKEFFSVWQAASVLINVNPFSSDSENLQYDERYNVARDLLDEAARLGKIKSERQNGDYVFHQNEIRTWAASIKREWCIPLLNDNESSAIVISEPKSNDVVLQRLQQSERENVVLQADKTRLTESLDKAQTKIDQLQQQLEEAADKLISETRSKTEFQTEFDSLKADALEGKTKSTLLKLLGGMAMIGAEIDIHATRIAGINQTVGDLALKGVVIDESTLSKRLKEAAELIAKPRK